MPSHTTFCSRRCAGATLSVAISPARRRSRAACARINTHQQLVRMVILCRRDEPPGRSAALRTVNTDWRAAVNALTTRLKPYRMQLLRHCCPGCTFPRLQQLDFAFAGSSGWLEPAVLKQLPVKMPSVSSLALDHWRCASPQYHRCMCWHGSETTWQRPNLLCMYPWATTSDGSWCALLWGMVKSCQCCQGHA